MNHDAHVRLTTEFGFAYALVTAAESGLLTALLRADAPVADVAGPLDLDRAGVDRVLQVLESHDWVRHTDDGWTVAEWVRRGEADGMRLERTLNVFGHVPQLARDGSTMLRGEVRHDAGAVTTLARMFAEPAAALGRTLPLGAGTVLDVGAGSAVWSLAMVGDEGRVIALDRPEVLEAATRLAAEQGATSRLELLPGSFWEVDLPQVDRVLIANVVHLLDDATSRKLVERSARALRPGGEFVVVDVLGSEPLDPALAAYSLHLRLREPQGIVHLRPNIVSWLEDAGLVDVRSIELAPALLRLGAVVGTARTTPSAAGAR